MEIFISVLLIVIGLWLLLNSIKGQQNQSTHHGEVEVKPVTKEINSPEDKNPVTFSVESKEDVYEKNEKPNYETLSFKVVGVTKKNENKREIQTLLKRIAKEFKEEYQLDSFDGLTNKEIKEYMFSGGEFERQYLTDCIEFVPEEDNPYDKHAIKVFLQNPEGNKYHVGYVGKEINKELIDILKTKNVRSIDCEFIGGKYKSVDYDPIEDKDIIVVEELTRGLQVNVSYQ